METILIGAVVALLILVSFFAGVRIGEKLTKDRQPVVPPTDPSEAENHRLIEDQRAFESLLHYNTDIVYGRRSDLGGDVSES